MNVTTNKGVLGLVEALANPVGEVTVHGGEHPFAAFASLPGVKELPEGKHKLYVKNGRTP